jgi:tripartite-type tricarboxylate transporter receptor subunit TctC
MVTAAHGQAFPTRGVTVVVPYAAGGSSDIMGRALAAGLGERWKQNVIVENRPGGTTTVGTEQVSRMPADGYTLLLAAPPFVITSHVYPALKYDVRRDFRGVSLVAFYPLIVVVPQSLPVNTFPELLAHLRSAGSGAYPSPGAGTTVHLINELMAQREKLNLVHVPYKSGAHGVTDLIAGRLTFYAGPTLEVLPHIRSGALKPLAVLGSARTSHLPDVPSSAELGYGYLQGSSWTTIAIRSDTPADIVNKINADIAALVKTSQFRDRMAPQGAEIVGSTPEATTEFYEQEHLRWGPIARALKLKPE